MLGNSPCGLCGMATDPFGIPVPTFRHIDFSTVSGEMTGRYCAGCDLIQQLPSFQRERESYYSEGYGNSAQTSHHQARNALHDPVRTRSIVQAELLSDLVIHESSTYLDIGCFDGALLVALREYAPSATLVGFDVNPISEAKGIDKDIWFTNREHDIYERKFDAVIYSHSIMYVENLRVQLEKIRSGLEDGGFVFIQLPDVTKRPLYALMGDQAFIFTMASLKKFLGHCGFISENLTITEFPYETAILARPGQNIADISTVALEVSIPKVPLWKKIEDSVTRLAAEIRRLLGSRRVYVLGTTINAAFIHELFPDHVLGFVDENFNHSISRFRGMPVCHSSDLDSNCMILVGPQGSNELRTRMINTYDAQII